MSDERDDQERPCLHCMMVELIDDFFAEYLAATGEPETIDPDEVVTAIAKTVAELTHGQDGTIRQQLIEQLMREIMDYDAEFRRGASVSSAARSSALATDRASADVNSTARCSPGASPSLSLGKSMFTSTLRPEYGAKVSLSAGSINNQ